MKQGTNSNGKFVPFAFTFICKTPLTNEVPWVSDSNTLLISYNLKKLSSTCNCFNGMLKSVVTKRFITR
jgi:hypothetical protein